MLPAGVRAHGGRTQNEQFANAHVHGQRSEVMSERRQLLWWRCVDVLVVCTHVTLVRRRR
jgi:hypothetical protein